MTAADGQPDRFDPAEMALRGRIGAFRLHATHDPRATTARARVAFLARFEAELDPERVLEPEERQRRALAARRAYVAQLALRSARGASIPPTARMTGRGHAERLSRLVAPIRRSLPGVSRSGTDRRAASGPARAATRRIAWDTTMLESMRAR